MIEDPGIIRSRDRVPGGERPAGDAMRPAYHRPKIYSKFNMLCFDIKTIPYSKFTANSVCYISILKQQSDPKFTEYVMIIRFVAPFRKTLDSYIRSHLPYGNDTDREPVPDRYRRPPRHLRHGAAGLRQHDLRQHQRTHKTELADPTVANPSCVVSGTVRR